MQCWLTFKVSYHCFRIVSVVKFLKVCNFVSPISRTRPASQITNIARLKPSFSIKKIIPCTTSKPVNREMSSDNQILELN
uniref:Uncharacterized protein n=1 Tax=Rhizophora mucronata TaxID=61149 RepID=A0A2P2LWN8_RHIMU